MNPPPIARARALLLRAAVLVAAGLAAMTAGAARLPAAQASAPVNGLVAHWAFDDATGTTAGDGSGNGHAGTLTNGPAWTGTSSCRVGGCLSFDGVNDYVKVADATTLKLTGDVTVSAWIKPTGLGTKQSIVSKRYEFELGDIGATAPYPLNWSHKDSSGTLVSGNLTTATDAGQWQHVVLVREAGPKRMRGYRNGSPAVTTTYTSGPGTSTYALNIGRNPGGGQRFKGLIDEVRIYNRALAAAEVQQLYEDAGAPLPPDTQAPSVPANLNAIAVSSSQVDLSWTASSDDRGVAGYRVFRDGAQVATPTGTAYQDTGRLPSTTYSYEVAAFDAAGNVSPRSSPVTATTPPSSPPPAQRQDTTVASGFANPTSMAIAPDGRIFVAEQGGKLRVVKNNTLLAAPFLSVAVTSTNERGLLGVTFDPNFASNGYVYVYYTSASPVVNRVSRFTASSANPDVAAAGSEVFVLDNIPSLTGWHNGGAIHFGGDGRLYVAVGEGHHADNAQSLSTLSGKVLRINADGSIPPDNPFYGTATGANRSIWALGLRNPFTFDVQPGTGRIFVNDVGENAWEEINEAWVGPNTGSNAGFNFGWPTCEGPQGGGAGDCTSPTFKYPVHAYPQAGGDCAITGGAFYNPSAVNFPAQYVGDYFFADYCSGWIKSLDVATKAVSDFIPGDGTRDPVDLKVGDDGSLYYLARSNGSTASLHRVRYTGSSQPPAIVSHPQDATAPVGGSATFGVSASGTAPLGYQWQRNSVDIPGATAASYTAANLQASDNGARFRAVVTNAYGTATSNAATLTVVSNQPPAATITQPAAGTTYAGGDTIAYAGSGSDPEEGSLPPAAFTWKVDFHHEAHVHPFLPETTGSQSGSFTIPRDGHTAADVFYRIYLTVRDSGGLSSTTSRDVVPRTARITLATSPPGLQLTLDGQPVATPHAVTSVVGVTRTLGAPSPQTSGGKTYEFVSWADGGTQTHGVNTPAADTTFTATYREVAGGPPPPPPPPTQGLVGHWSFDEGTGTTAADSSGNGNTGTLTYGPTWASVVSCKVGACVSLDGADDYVRVFDAAPLRLTGDVTVSAWIKPTRLGVIQSVVSKRYEFELGPISDVGAAPLEWSYKQSSGALVSGDLTTATDLNQWQHVVLVRNAATGQIKGYKNGSGVTSGYSFAPGTSSHNLNIGRNPGSIQHFQGLIDEVRIYNRALGDAEVAALFAQNS